MASMMWQIRKSWKDDFVYDPNLMQGITAVGQCPDVHILVLAWGRWRNIPKHCVRAWLECGRGRAKARAPNRNESSSPMDEFSQFIESSIHLVPPDDSTGL